MTSVFDEKKKKRDEPTGNEIDTILEMHKTMSLREISKQTGYAENVLKPLFPQMKKTGSKPKEKRITADEVRNAYVHVLEAQKQTNKAKLGENPTRQQIIKATGIKNLHALVLTYLTKKGWDISDSTLRRNFAKIDFEKEIQGETIALPHEAKAKVLKEQEEWQRAENNKKWIAKTTSEYRQRTLSNLAYINKLIAMRHGEWENIDPKDVDNNEKLAKIFHETHEQGKPVPICNKPKTVPISDWTQDDIMWALLYIDWVSESGQQHYRLAINHLLTSNPKLLIKEQELEHLDAVKKEWGRSTYHEKFGVKEEQQESAAAQESKIGKFKKPPSPAQVKKMLDLLNHKKFEGRSFKDLKDKNGETVKLSKKEFEALERETVKLAINLTARTGMRAGHQRQTEMGSLRFADIYWNENQINAATKTSKRKKVLTEVDPTVIQLIKDWKDKLEAKNIDVSKMYIIHTPIQSLNDHLREIAEEAGVCKYIRQYGEYRTLPGSRGKKYLHIFQKGEPGYGDPKNLRYQMNFQGQRVTLDPIDPDPHLHLFRAFHLWELAKADIPLEYAIKIGFGWEDPKTALECYLAALTEEKVKKYRIKEKEIFSAIA